MANDEIARTGNGLVQIVDALGLAAAPFRESGAQGITLPACFMAISTNESMYPDQQVIDYINCARQFSHHVYLLVADGMQMWNKAGIDPRGKAILHDCAKVHDVKRRARRRVENFRDYFSDCNDVSVILLDEELVHNCMTAEDREHEAHLPARELFRDYKALLLGDGQFRADLEAIVRRNAPDLVEQARQNGVDERHAMDNFVRYGGYEVFFTLLMAYNGVPFKFGPRTERPYDEVTLRVLNGEYELHPNFDHKIGFGGLYMDYATEATK